MHAAGQNATVAFETRYIATDVADTICLPPVVRCTNEQIPKTLTDPQKRYRDKRPLRSKLANFPNRQCI